MYQTRQPITDANFEAHQALARNRFAAGLQETVPAASRRAMPNYAGARLRDPKEEMVQLFLENAQITKDEMLEYFDDSQIDRYVSEARHEAKRRQERRAA